MHAVVLSLALFGASSSPPEADPRRVPPTPETMARDVAPTGEEPGPSESAEPADPPDPAALAAEAQAAFQAGRFAEASELAGRAHALTGDPRHLYAQAVAERRLGRCREALIFYARVLASVQDDPAYSALVDGTRQGIKLCEAALDAPPESVPPPAGAQPGAPDATDPAPPPPDDRPPRDPRSRAWARDPLGGVLLGLGLGVAGAAGGTLWGLSVRRLDAADRATDETIYADQRAQARGLRAGAIASFGLGGALLVGAAIRYGLVARAPGRSTAWLAPWPGGGGVTWRRSF